MPKNNFEFTLFFKLSYFYFKGSALLHNLYSQIELLWNFCFFKLSVFIELDKLHSLKLQDFMFLKFNKRQLQGYSY